MKIFSIQIMYSTDFSGSSFHHPGTGGQQFSKMKPTGTHKKKEERFYPSGQLLWDKGEWERPSAPRSDVHKHTVTTRRIQDSQESQNRKLGPARWEWTTNSQERRPRSIRRKKKRFYLSGQLLWDKGELERPPAPRSDVHKHTVTAGESKNPKDHRRENWDQPEEKDHK